MPPAETLQARSADVPAMHGRPSPRRAPPPVEYPESDGKPMSESTIHWEATVDGAQPLKVRYRERPDAFVGSDLLMFLEEGDPSKSVSPDVFVTFGVPREPPRPKWLVWEEGAAADFVLEVTSKTTRANDEGRKKRLYQKLGVREYWQFDPTGDYLAPILKGHRLGPDGRYRKIDLEERGNILSGWSEVLGLELHLEDGRLRYFDPDQGAYLATFREQDGIIADQDEVIANQGKVIADQRRAIEDRDRTLQAAEARIAQLEQQLRRGG